METKKIVELQLDRKINNYQKTAKFCPFDFPAVILVNPYKNKIPAPTIYWLSCPYLNYKVDRLEAESSLIDELVNKMKNDSDFKRSIEASHQEYAFKRRQILETKQLEAAKQLSLDLYDTLLNSGVGGIRDRGGIKCLHTHLADYLVNESNPVGEIVYNLVEWPETCSICKERIEKSESSSN